MSHVFEVTSVHRGDDIRIAKMCKALEHAGHTVTVAAMTGGTAVKPEGRWNVVSYGQRSRKRWIRLIQQPKLWRLLAKARPDAIQFHDPELLPLMLWLAGPRGRRRRIVYDMHEDVAASLRDRGCSELVARTYEILLRFAERRMWITLAEDSYRSVVGQPWPVIHNYPCDAGPGLAQRQRQAIYIGDVAKGRGAFEMLRAFALADLPGWRLAIVGPCDEPGTEQHLAADAADLGLGDRFLRVGAIPPVEVHQWLKASSIGLAVLHPLRNYVGCPPGKVFEYALAGLPSVVSDFPFYRRCFDVLPSVTFVNPLDIHAVAAALKRIAGNLQNLEADCAVARRIALDRYSWGSEVLRVNSLFDFVLAADVGAKEEYFERRPVDGPVKL